MGEYPPFSGNAPGTQPNVPFYVVNEPAKLSLPTDWDGTSTTWPLFKLQTEMACQAAHMPFLTSDNETTPLTAQPSKRFAEAIIKSAPYTSLSEFLGTERAFFMKHGIEMFQRLRQIHEPTHDLAVMNIIDKVNTLCIGPTETPSEYRMRVELLNERLPTHVAYPPTLLAHFALRGLDNARYGAFKQNIMNGNKSVETVKKLFEDIQTFDHAQLPAPPNDTTTTSRSASARTVTFADLPSRSGSSPPPSTSDQTFGWKGQADLNEQQVEFLLNKYVTRGGCIYCRTKSHSSEDSAACPVYNRTHPSTTQQHSNTGTGSNRSNGNRSNNRSNNNRSNNNNRSTATGSARQATADPDTMTTTMTATETTPADQGKSSIISTPAPPESSLLHSATSDQHLTSLSSPPQDKITENDDVDPSGSFQQEIFPEPEDPSLQPAMRIRRDNASKIALAQTSRSLFVGPIGPCMGRAQQTLLAKSIQSGHACVDSGATHDMAPGVKEDFANYRPLPPGSHVLLANKQPTPALGIGTQYYRIDGYIIGRREVLHVPALSAPLISVRQHRRHQGCSFVADNDGCFLSWPTFTIEVDDRRDCLVQYSLIAPTGFDASSCDFAPQDADCIEDLAITETRRFELARKARSPQYQSKAPVVKWGRGMQHQIQTPQEAEEQGYARRVETRASRRRQQEAEDSEREHKAAMDRQLSELLAELHRLQTEGEQPLSDDAVRQIAQSLVTSLEKKGFIDPELQRQIETGDFTTPNDSKGNTSATDETRAPGPKVEMVLDDDENDGFETVYDDDDDSPPPKPSPPGIPTTTTPDGRPDALPCHKPPSATPAVQRLTEQQLHRYFGFRNLKNYMDLETTGQATIKVVKGTERPLEIGDVANIRYSRCNTKPIPRPSEYLRTVHMDIGYGDCVSIGGFRYILLLVDRTTRYQWAYGLTSMTQDTIITALEKFHAEAGGLPQKIYTDFDPKLISGKTEQWLLTKIPDKPCRVFAAPSGRQNENGLVERAWQTTVAMARSYITDMQMPRAYWFWALRHANQVMNYIPCKVNGELTTPFELVHGVKPDYRVLLRLFSTTYYRIESEGGREHDGIAEALSKQGIVIGRDRKSDGILIYCPHMKQYYTTNSYKIDEGRSTANAFNLKYDGGIFIGLYDNGPSSQGVEPYPKGTGVLINNVRGTVISIPSPALDRRIPDSDDQTYYVIRLIAKTATDARWHRHQYHSCCRYRNAINHPPTCSLGTVFICSFLDRCRTEGHLFP